MAERCVKSWQTERLSSRSYHGPVCLALADVEDELSNDCTSLWSMRDFRVELDAEERLFVVRNAGKGCRRSPTDHLEFRWNAVELIAM